MREGEGGFGQKVLNRRGWWSTEGDAEVSEVDS